MRALLQDRLRTDARLGTGASLRVALWLLAGVLLWLAGLARRPETAITVEEAKAWGELALWGLSLVQTAVVWLAAPWVVAQAVLEDREQGLERALNGAVRPARAQASRVLALVWPVVVASWAVVPAMAMTTLLGTSIWAVLSGVLAPLVVALGLGGVALVTAQRIDHRWAAVMLAWLVAVPVWFFPAPVMAMLNWDWRHMAEVAPWASTWVEHPGWWAGWLIGVPLFWSAVNVAATVGATGPQGPGRVAFMGRRAWNLTWMGVLFSIVVLAVLFPLWVGMVFVAMPTGKPLGVASIGAWKVPYVWFGLPGRVILYATGAAMAALWTRVGLMFSLDLTYHLAKLPDGLRAAVVGQSGDAWQKATWLWLWPMGPMTRWIGKEPATSAAATISLLCGLGLSLAMVSVAFWVPGAPAATALLTACFIASWVAHGGATAQERAALEAPGRTRRYRYALMMAGLALAAPALMVAFLGRTLSHIPALGDGFTPLLMDLALLPGLLLAATAWGRWSGRLGLGRLSMLGIGGAAASGVAAAGIWLEWAPDKLQEVLVVVAAMPRSFLNDPVAGWAHFTALAGVWVIAVLATSTALVGRR